MKTIFASILLVAAGASWAAVGDTVNGPLVTKWIEDNNTTIIKHKKGWAAVLTLRGDRGTGLEIIQGNKQASGIRMKSGNANLEISPSYVAAGVPNVLGFSRETAAVVFKVSGAKLDGTDNTWVAFDVKRQKILYVRDGAIVGELAIPAPAP